MRNFSTQKRRRVIFKLSHHALGLLPASDHPFTKKPRIARALKQEEKAAAAAEEAEEENVQGNGDEEAEDDNADGYDYEEEYQKEAKAYKPAIRENGNSKHPALLHPPTPKGKPKSYLEKLQARLSGGQFRMLNERLYTSSGDEAFEFFKEDPTAFHCYHAGYQEQMSRWPSQPLDVIIKWLKKRSTSLVVADFGCGDGKLAKSVENRVFSLDLVAFDETILACNMAHTPLKTHSVDVTVFCLSLMGTDYSSFLAEAHRVLKPRGTLLIAEVRSRFDPNNGGADPAHFVKALNLLGFSLVSKDFSNKLFVVFEFSKQISKGTSQKCKWPSLKPCIYKRR